MAKRVNTQFVAMLGTTLAVVGAGVGGLLWYKSRHKVEDPAPLLQSAKAAEQAGDLVAAEDFYYRAANGTRDMKLPGADDLFFKVAELDLKLSERSKTPEEGVRYLQHYYLMLKNAEGINPRNSKVAQKLIDDKYLYANTQPQASNWLDLVQEVTRFINNQNEATPASAYTMRGEARFQWVNSVPTKDVSEKDYAEIEKDLKTAMTMDPESGKAAAYMGRYIVLQGKILIGLRQLEQARDKFRESQTLLDAFWQKHENDPDVAVAKAMSIRYAQGLAQIYADGVPPRNEAEVKEWMGKKEDPNQPGTLVYDQDSLLKVLTEAHGAHPGNETLAEALENYYLQMKPEGTTPEEKTASRKQLADKAESVLKDLVTAHPDDPMSYFRIAKLAQFEGDLAKAIFWHKECLNHILPWAGQSTARHRLLQQESLFFAAWNSMDLADSLQMKAADKDAEVAAKAAAEIKAALADSLEFGNKFRTAHFDTGWQSLQDGRMQLIQNKTLDAITSLNQAEDNLGKARAAELLRMTKMELGDAYYQLRPPQLGKALEYYSAAIDLQADPIAMIKKSQVLNQLARYDESKKLMEELLDAKNQWSQPILELARTKLAVAKEGLAKGTGVSDLIVVGTSQSLTDAANLQLGSGDMAGALMTLTKVLERDESFLPALRMAIMVNMNLGKREDAAKVVELGLKNYKDDPQFLFVKKLLEGPIDKDPDVAQEKLVEIIPDEYMKQSQYAALYHWRVENRDPKMALSNLDKEIEALQKAEALITDKDAPGGRSRLEEMVQRGFAAAMLAANYANNAASLVENEYRAKNPPPADAEKNKAAMTKYLAEVTASSAKERATMDKYYAAGQAYVSKAEQYNLDGVGGQLYRGRLEFAKNPGPAAIASLEKVVAMQPEIAPPRIYLAGAYMELRPPNEEKALEELKKAVRLKPDDISLIRSTIQLLLRKPTTSNVADAQELLKQGLAMSPADPFLAQFADLIGDPDVAIARREAILKADPGDTANWRRLSILYAQRAYTLTLTLRDKKGDEKATLELNKTIKESLARAVALVKPLVETKTRPDLTDTVLVATLMASNEDVDGAIRLFDPYISASADEKTRYEGLQALGDFCMKAGRPKEAEEKYLAAMELQKDDDSAERRLGDFYFDMDYMEKAETTYRKIYVRAKENEPTVVRRLIEVLIRQDKCTEADQLLATKVLKDNPNDPQGLVLRAFSKIRQNKPAEAMVDTKLVLEKHPDYAEAMYYHAMARVSLLKDLDLAAQDLLTLANRYEDVPKYRVLLLNIYRYNRNYSGVAAQYDELLRNRPGLKPIRKEYANFLMGLVLLQQRMGVDRTDAVSVSIRNVKPVETLQAMLWESMHLKGEEQEPLWLLMYGDLAMMGNNLEVANQAYGLVYKNLPENVAGVNSYMKLLVHQGQFDKAVEVGTKFLNTPDDAAPATQPSDDPPLKHKEQTDIYMRRAAAYAGLKKDAEARADVDQILALTIADGHIVKTDAAGNKSQNYLSFLMALSQTSEVVTPDVVMDRLKLRLGTDPKDYVASAGLLHILVALNRPAEALEVVKKTTMPAEDRFIGNLFLRDTAMAYYQNKEYDTSIAKFNELMKGWPDDLEGLNNFAYVLGEMKRPKEALVYIEKAVKVVDANPDQYYLSGANGGIYDTYGWIKHLLGDELGAIDQLERSVNALPIPSTYLHLATAQKAAKRMEDARKSAEMGIKVANPSDPTVAELQAFLKDLGN